MFKFRKQFLIGITALSIGAIGMTAYADTAANAPSAEQQAKFAEHMAKHQAKLHDDLKITPAQEGAWQTFIAKMKPTMPAARHPSKEEWAKQTAPERLDREADFLKRAEARLAVRTAAVKEFYAVLTPEQQKVFDEHFRKMHHGRFGHHGFGRDHHEGESADRH